MHMAYSAPARVDTAESKVTRFWISPLTRWLFRRAGPELTVPHFEGQTAAIQTGQSSISSAPSCWALSQNLGAAAVKQFNFPYAYDDSSAG